MYNEQSLLERIDELEDYLEVCEGELQIVEGELVDANEVLNEVQDILEDESTTNEQKLYKLCDLFALPKEKYNI